MRIGVDARPFASPTGRGVGHYAEQLVSELVRRHPKDEWVLLQTGRRPWRPSPGLQRRNVSVRHLRIPNKVLNGTLASSGQPSLRQLIGPVDVFFMPNIGFLPRPGDVPLVLTVHDLSFERMPEFYSSRERIWHVGARPRRLAGVARRVIAVSDETRRELIRWYGVPSANVTTVHLGIDAGLKPPAVRERKRIRRKYKLPESYFLYVGAYEPRKNLPALLEGFRRARRDGLAAGLVLVGPGTGAGAKAARAAGAQILGYVPAGDKSGLYGEALAVVLVSKHEGFGLPPLEALACGTPGLVSPLRIFDETVGGGAMRARGSAAIGRELLRLERSPGLRQRLVTRGRRRLPQFRWGRAAASTYRLLTQAARSRIS